MNKHLVAFTAAFLFTAGIVHAAEPAAHPSVARRATPEWTVTTYADPAQHGYQVHYENRRFDGWSGPFNQTDVPPGVAVTLRDAWRDFWCGLPAAA